MVRRVTNLLPRGSTTLLGAPCYYLPPPTFRAAEQTLTQCGFEVWLAEKVVTRQPLTQGLYDFAWGPVLWRSEEENM